MVDLACLDDVEASARQILSLREITYISMASDSGQTAAENVNAFQR